MASAASGFLLGDGAMASAALGDDAMASAASGAASGASGFLLGDDAVEFMQERGEQTWEAANEAGGCGAVWLDDCAQCGDGGGLRACCGYCNHVFHPMCLDPPQDDVENWDEVAFACGLCVAEAKAKPAITTQTQGARLKRQMRQQRATTAAAEARRAARDKDIRDEHDAIALFVERAHTPRVGGADVGALGEDSVRGALGALAPGDIATIAVARRVRADAREQTLQDIASRNPVATTLAFMRARSNVAANVIGRTSTPGGKACAPTAGRSRGAFGVPTCGREVCEGNNRSALHSHGIHSGGAAGQLLGDSVADPRLRVVAEEALASQVSGSLPLEFHLAHRASVALGVGNPRCTAFGAMLDGSGGGDGGSGGGASGASDRAWREERCDPLTRCVAVFTGTHAHMATCCKGNNGRQGCRFGAPFPHDVPRGGGSAGAQIVQLASAASGDGEGTIMAACTRANSVPMLLGVGDAGKAAGYYMLKYMGKPLCDPAASLDVFVAAAQHVSDPGRASTAADAHTSRRTALHFAERVLNASMQELEAPFAASIVVL